MKFTKRGSSKSAKILLSALIVLILNSVNIVQADENDDPLEPINRVIFEFNEVVDDNILEPVAKGYKYVTPDPVEKGVSNFFSNLGEINTIANDLLQLKFQQAAKDSLRFVVNSTIGVLGIFDVATPLGLSKNKEDFGQTLGFWGVPNGPYLVLPFLGPSSFRDAPGTFVDYEMSPMEQLHHEERQTLRLMNIIETRAKLLRATKILDTAAKDKYIFIRESYLQKRESLIRDGENEEEFEIDVYGIDD